MLYWATPKKYESMWEVLLSVTVCVSGSEMAGMFSAAYLGVLEGFYALGKNLYYQNNDVFSYLVIAFVCVGCACNMYKNY